MVYYDIRQPVHIQLPETAHLRALLPKRKYHERTILQIISIPDKSTKGKNNTEN